MGKPYGFPFIFFIKEVKYNKMAQIAYVKSYRTLPFDKEEDYGFYDIVYVRSSKESYNKKIKDYVLKTIGGKKGSVETKAWNLAFQLQAENSIKKFYEDRELWLQNQGLMQGDRQTYENIMDNAVKELEQNIRNHYSNIGSKEEVPSTSSMITAMGNVIKDFKTSGQVKTINDLLTKAREMEVKINNSGLNTDDLRNYLQAFNKENTTNSGDKLIIVRQNGRAEFQGLRNTLIKMSKEQVTASKLSSEMPRYAGELEELLVMYEQNIPESFIEENLPKKIGNTRMTSKYTPTKSLTGKSINAGSAKPDNVFDMEIDLNGKRLLITIGASIKVSGTQGRNTRVKAHTLSAKDSLKDILEKIYGVGLDAEYQNAIYNSLVLTSSTNEIKMIKKNIISSYFVQAWTGTNSPLKEALGISDMADIIIINGKPYPMYKLLNNIMKEFQKAASMPDNVTSSMNITFEKPKDINKWVGEENKPNTLNAYSRSDSAINALLSKTTVIFNISKNKLLSMLQ